MKASDPLKSIDVDPYVGYPAEIEHDRASLQGWMAGTLVADMRAGTRIPTPAEAEAWGMGPESTDDDHVDTLSNPWNSPEKVKQFDIQRCVDVDPSLITTSGVAYELVHLRTPENGIGVVERLPTVFAEVVSLDGAGVPFFEHGNLNGSRPCTNEIRHADPNVTDPLTWLFFFQWVSRSSNQRTTVSGTMGYRSGVPVGQVGGEQVLPPWPDLRYGRQAIFGADEQFVFPRGALIRTWVALFGPSDRFAVRVGQCLSGYTQGGGHRGAALDNVIVRRI